MVCKFSVELSPSGREGAETVGLPVLGMEGGEERRVRGRRRGCGSGMGGGVLK